MLKALLADRYRMVSRLEKREVQGYALVKNRADGRLGPNLKPTTTACVGPRGEANPLAIQCAGRGAAAGAVRIVGVPMAQLAALISLVVSRPVVDRTGLDGNYELELRFSGGAVPGALPPDPGAPSIFTALQEQLGLKLDAERELADVLVIEKIERPTENLRRPVTSTHVAAISGGLVRLQVGEEPWAFAESTRQRQRSRPLCSAPACARRRRLNSKWLR